MKKTVQAKQGRDIYFEHFKTLENLIDTMDKRPLNAAFQQKKSELSSQRDETKNSRKWYETNTYSDAMEVLRVGYKDPLEQMKKAILKLGRSEKRTRPRIHESVVGFAPNVPAGLMNLPESMFNREYQSKKSKTLHLTYSFCVLGDVSPNTIIKGGVNFISLVNSLEKQGYRIKIDIAFVTVTNKTAAGFTVNLKEYGQRLNLLKLAFPLVHPSMLRRFAFRWLETVPNLTDTSFIGGYGQTLGVEMNDDGRREQAYMIENKMLKDGNSYYCNAYEAFGSKDVETLAKKMGLN